MNEDNRILQLNSNVKNLYIFWKEFQFNYDKEIKWKVTHCIYDSFDSNINNLFNN